MSLRCQKLVFINTIVSSTTYLRGVILRDLVACAKIDAVALKMARKLLGTNGPLPLSATNLLVILHSGVHLAYAQQAQMRVRVLETARLTPSSLLNLIRIKRIFFKKITIVIKNKSMFKNTRSFSVTKKTFKIFSKI
jgi:hypothetical protein